MAMVDALSQHAHLLHFFYFLIFFQTYCLQCKKCTTSAFRDEPCRMLKIIQRFGKHCSCHLQGEYVMVGHFWQPYIGQTVGGELNLMVLFRGTEEQAG
jgi:hypothetical protein